MSVLTLQILLAITFVFGVLRLLTNTKVFDMRLIGILETIFTVQSTKHIFGILVKYLDNIIFYGSLAFQAWYWLFRHVSL